MPVWRACSFVVLALGAIALGAACRDPFEPPNHPLDTCRRSCEKRAKRQCSEAKCERGCEMIIDRIVEREADNVIACVARSPRICTDVVWADCAAQIGPHADGGPPGPPPPPEED